MLAANKWDHAVTQKPVNENSEAERKIEILYLQKDAAASRHHTREPGTSNRADING